MQTNRKNLLIAASVILLIILICLWFFVIHRGKKMHPPAINALPENVLFFYKGKNITTFYPDLVEKSFWKELTKNHSVLEIDQQLITLDSLVRNNNKLLSVFQKNEVILSLHRTSAATVGVLGLVQVKNSLTYKDIASLIVTKKHYLLATRIYKDVQIYDYQLTPQKSLVAFAIKDGILMISPNALLVEDAITTLLLNGSKESPFARQCKSVANENFFVNYRNINSFFEIFLNPESKSLVSDLKNFGGTGRYEAEFKKDFLILRGDIQVKDSSPDFVNLFYGQKPMHADFYKVFPEHTAALVSCNLENFSLYYRKYQDRLKFLNELPAHESLEKSFESRYHISIQNDLIPCLSGQFSLVVNEPLSQDLKNSTLIFVKISNMEKALRIFARPSESDEDTASTENSAPPASYKNYRIYRTTLSESFRILFGKMYNNIGQTDFIVVRDYLVFSPNPDHLKRYIDDYTNGLTLANSPEFIRFSEKLVTETNFTLLINPFRAMKIPESYTDSSLSKSLRKNADYLNNFSFFAFNIANNNNSFYNEILTHYLPKAGVNRENLWSVGLESPVIMKPLVIKNSQSGSYDIIVVDKGNTIYSISASGSVNWKVRLDSRPVGPVVPIDLFDNNKTQLLIITQDKAWAIDRLGRDAGAYPIKIPKSPVSGFCLAGTKEITRFIVGCEDNTVYGFEKNGKPAAGWNPKHIKGNICLPLKSFVRNNRNYIFGLTDENIFYLWDLRGKDVFHSINLRAHFKNPFYVILGNNDKNSWIVSADTAGNTWFIDLDGQAGSKKTGRSDGNTYFLVADFNDDNDLELIYVNPDGITAYSPEGKQLYSIRNEAGAGSLPEIISAGGKNYLSFLDKDKNYIYAIDIQGHSLKGFPFPSNSEGTFFDLNKDNRTELIRTEGNTVYLSRF